jgi:NAD(P)-dependent dehydrogenase (short-subunit alcohol dehydrogenase family)
MKQRGYGKILNMASTAAFAPGPLMAVYYASKAYVLSFSEAIAAEMQGTGVTVTALRVPAASSDARLETGSGRADERANGSGNWLQRFDERRAYGNPWFHEPGAVFHSAPTATQHGRACRDEFAAKSKPLVRSTPLQSGDQG